MQRSVSLAHQPIDEAALARRGRPSGSAGAVLTFVGVVRDKEGGLAIEALEYEAFEAMAEHQFHRLLDELERRWPIESVCLVHRLGKVPVGEASFGVQIIGPHRAEAIAACEWLIHQMKQVVPIWKRPTGGTNRSRP